MIFVIEDDRGWENYYRRILKQYKLKFFHDGVAAVLGMNEEVPELVILDILLTGPTGFAVLNEMRSYPDLANVPVIVVTSVQIKTALAKQYGVAAVLDKGEMTEKEAFTHPDNNIITRGLGDVDSTSRPDIVSYSIHPNDILLLCSDGLCGYNTNKEIERVLDKNSVDIIKCRDELLSLSLNAGGYDNICIALASLISNEQSAPSIPTFIQRLFIWLKRLVSN